MADLTASASDLRGVDVPPELVPQTIDEFPILAATALFARGTTRITGAAELRVKESDRIRTMCLELAKLGARVRELPDGLEIEGGRPLRGAACASHGDHRVAMSLAVAGGAIRGETRIARHRLRGDELPGVLGPDARARRAGRRGLAPGPWRRLIIAIDGPAAAGKSTAGKALAARLGYLYIDTGALYRAVAWLAEREGLADAPGAAVAARARAADIRLEGEPAQPARARRRPGRLGRDPHPRMSDLSSRLSALPEVRAALLGLQRRLGAAGGVVMDGRDIGTVIFPGRGRQVLRLRLAGGPRAPAPRGAARARPALGRGARARGARGARPRATPAATWRRCARRTTPSHDRRASTESTHRPRRSTAPDGRMRARRHAERRRGRRQRAAARDGVERPA